MAYFSPEFTDFFSRLERNNTRDWFQIHKRDYERFVKDPFNAFVAEVIDRVSLVDSEIAIEPKDATFRIARDIRFSRDKTPYKTHVAAVISRGGRKDMRYPGLFFRFDAKGIGIGGGVYQPDKETLLAIRRAIARDGAALARALKGKAFREVFGELQGEKNKRLPKEFAAVAERLPIIAHKQFYYFVEYDDPRLVLRDDLPAFVLRHYRAGRKVSEFLGAAVTARGGGRSRR